MRKKVLLLHGWGGSDNPHWQSWLAGELAKKYGCVNFLRFSDMDEPNLGVWMSELHLTLHDFQPDIVICHSLANTLWFHICNAKPMREVETLYLVAPPSLNCQVQELKEFFPVSAPKNLYAKNSFLVTSTNDPYMSKEETFILQKELNIPMKMIENAGHINSDSGYGKWEWFLEQVKSQTLDIS
ncbi:MAG: alpha/beta hydrolase [Campylobacterota bacterium]|nr:alpha/beta hydrolase [Campylobacterota bacterium]